MADLLLTEKIYGRRRTRILQEFVTNSAVYPLFDAIRSISNKGFIGYWQEVPHYFLILSAFIQAGYLGWRNPMPWQKRALGNLIAPVLYTAVDVLIEGWDGVINQPYHWVYWGFSLIMALLYAWEGLLPHLQLLSTFFKNIGRVLLFPVLYAISELTGELAELSWHSFIQYWQGSSGHVFIFLASILLGLLLGLADAQTEQYLQLLRKTAHRLKQFSEWSFSSELLARSLTDQEALEQHRVYRAVLFADIRGFTSWSESKTPEMVVAMLNEFYDIAEKIIVENQGAKPHFIGDEVMTWFVDPKQAIETAVTLKQTLQKMLQPYDLSVGLGLHAGDVIEGLLGSKSTRSYDILGDTVNTASRLMNAAQSGELLVSEAAAHFAPEKFHTASLRYIDAKGKRERLTAYVA